MEIVPFETAKKLKEKGFPQRPDYFNYSSYYDWDGLRKIHSLSNASVWFDPNISRDNIYFAPTISQVLKWLREKDIMVEILVDLGDNGVWQFTFRIQTKEFYERAAKCDYASYESASLSCIEYVIDNLI